MDMFRARATLRPGVAMDLQDSGTLRGDTLAIFKKYEIIFSFIAKESVWGPLKLLKYPLFCYLINISLYI